jgi:hypothetical protein
VVKAADGSRYEATAVMIKYCFMFGSGCSSPDSTQSWVLYPYL